MISKGRIEENGEKKKKKNQGPEICSILEDIVPGVAWNRVSWTLPLLFLLFPCRSLCVSRWKLLSSKARAQTSGIKFGLMSWTDVFFVKNHSPDNPINFIPPIICRLIKRPGGERVRYFPLNWKLIDWTGQ